MEMRSFFHACPYNFLSFSDLFHVKMKIPHQAALSREPPRLHKWHRCLIKALAVDDIGQKPLKQRTYHSDDFVLAPVVGMMAH
jgi:hypothetical protein